MAWNPKAIPVLIGHGITELSMIGPAIPVAKVILRRLSLESAKKIAAQAVQLRSAEAVESFLDKGVQKLLEAE